MNQKIFYLLLLMVVSMGSQAEMKSTPFNENSFSKIACSPVVDKSIKEGVFFNMPKTMQWGQEIPICAYLRGSKALANVHTMSSFRVQIRDASGEHFSRDSSNAELGTPPIRLTPKAFEILAEKGEVFFNGNITNQYTVLAPGQYTISISYFEFESERKKLTVVSSGWRKALTHFISQETCKGNMVKNLSDYLELQHMLSVLDLTPEAFEEAQIGLEKNWHHGFKKYKPQIKNEWRKGLKESQKLDRTIPLQIIKQLKEKCNKKELNDSDIYYIYEGLWKFEAEQASKD